MAVEGKCDVHVLALHQREGGCVDVALLLVVTGIEERPRVLLHRFVLANDLDRRTGAKVPAPLDSLGATDAHEECRVRLGEHVVRREELCSLGDKPGTTGSRRFMLAFGAVAQRDERARVDEDTGHTGTHAAHMMSLSAIPEPRVYGAVMRVAAVDLGTNSTRLLVADIEDGHIAEVVRRLAITRLGEGVDVNHELLPAPMDRVHAVLDGYAEEARSLGAERVLAVATSAVRDASNGRAFLQGLGERYGWLTRLLDGNEEAETTFRGVTSDRTLEGDTLMVDIGGGSTELLVGGPDGVSFATSLQIGCVRVTERFFAGDPPTSPEIEAAAAFAGSLLPALDVERAIGVAGTITTVAAIDLELGEYDPVQIHGHRISRGAADRALEQLAALPLAARERVRGLEPARAPVIVGGLVVLREVMKRYGLSEIEASERDILHGVALAAAETPATG